jgi:hypothetical protein
MSRLCSAFRFTSFSVLLVCAVTATTSGDEHQHHVRLVKLPTIEICHIPPGNPSNFHTITVSENALDAHSAHGDPVGSCNENCNDLCSDGNACTVDHFNDCEEEGCIPEADRPPLFCDDGDYCNGIETCDPATGCQDGVDPCQAPLLCDEPNARCVDCLQDSDCPDGSTCNDGSCFGPDPECAGATCQTFIPCEGNSCASPVCGTLSSDGTTGNGGGVCVEGTTPCLGLSNCFNGDCPVGSFCAIDSCCAVPVCVPPSAFCANSRRNLDGRELEGPTIGHL